MSPRAFPETLPPVEYSPGDHVRSVQDGGFVSYLGREFRVGKAFQGERVAIRPTTVDGILDVYFCDQKVSKINLKGDREKHRVD